MADVAARSGKELSLSPASGTTSPASPAAASIAQHVLSLGQLDVDRRLDFVAANRVVAVLEKAVERLQLLSLLDELAPAPADTTLSAPASDADGEETGPRADAGTGTATQTGVQRILARFAVHAKDGGATVREAILASAATPRPAATFVSLEHGDGSTTAPSRRTAAQVAAALAEASADTRRGRPSVAELLAEQQQLESRYGELLRAAQRLGLSGAGEGVAAQAAGQAAAATVQLCFTHVRDPERAAVQRELAAVSQRLREHNRRLCTQLRDHPNDDDNWRKVANERVELTALLRQTIAELTQGYAESRRGNYSGSGALAGSFRGAEGLRRADSKGSLVSGPAGGGAGHEGSLSRNGSQQSEGMDNRSQSVSSSQQHSLGLTKRFGSTIQMRRVIKAANNQPRIPLVSGYAHVARKVLQEDAAQRWADDLVRKERELNQNVKQLQADLQLERAKREREVADRQQRIHGLRVQLRELKRDLKQRSDEAKAEAEAAAEGQARRAGEAEAVIDGVCAKLQRGLSTEQRTHELFTQHLVRRAADMDAIGSDWQRKNPAELKRADLRRMDAEQTQQQCSERLQGCEAEMVQQRELKAARDAERAAEEAAAREAEVQRQAQYAAASRLQSAVRAMLTRDAVGKLRKKGGKKKQRASVAGGA